MEIFKFGLCFKRMPFHAQVLFQHKTKFFFKSRISVKAQVKNGANKYARVHRSHCQLYTAYWNTNVKISEGDCTFFFSNDVLVFVSYISSRRWLQSSCSLRTYDVIRKRSIKTLKSWENHTHLIRFGEFEEVQTVGIPLMNNTFQRFPFFISSHNHCHFGVHGKRMRAVSWKQLQTQTQLNTYDKTTGKVAPN